MNSLITLTFFLHYVANPDPLISRSSITLKSTLMIHNNFVYIWS